MQSSGLEKLLKGIEIVAAAILAVATLNVFVSGVLRYTLNVGIPDSSDFGRMMLGIVAFFGIGTIGLRGSHIVVTALADILPGAWARLLIAFADIVTCGAMGILCWALVGKALAARRENLTSFDLGTPLWGFYVVAAVGLGLGTLAYVWAIVSRRRPGLPTSAELPEKEGINL